MFVEIVTPDKKVFEGEADGVQVPGADGSFEILRKHAPIIASLEQGKVRITQGKEKYFFTITGGLVEANQDKVIVLAESVMQA